MWMMYHLEGVEGRRTDAVKFHVTKLRAVVRKRGALSKYLNISSVRIHEHLPQRPLTALLAAINAMHSLSSPDVLAART